MKILDPSLPYYSHIARARINGFIPFPIRTSSDMKC